MMNENTKLEIEVILDLLRGCLIKNGVSMAMDFENKELLFFDTDTYLNEKKFSGFSVKTDDLVN